jgi:hypothetical protein
MLAFICIPQAEVETAGPGRASTGGITVPGCIHSGYGTVVFDTYAHFQLSRELMGRFTGFVFYTRQVEADRHVGFIGKACTHCYPFVVVFVTMPRAGPVRDDVNSM